MVQLLLRHRADTNAVGDREPRTALFTLQWAEVTRLLLDARADPNFKDRFVGKTPLHVSEEVEHARLLLEARASVNERCGDGRVPLWHAIQRNDKAMVECLASQSGVDLEASDILGNTLVQQARQPYLRACLTPLLRHRAKLSSSASEIQCSVLHQAVESILSGEELKELVETLLDLSCCDINQKNGNHQTALFMAAVRNKYNLCEILLVAGADTSIGSVCYCLARCCSHSGAAQISNHLPYLGC